MTEASSFTTFNSEGKAGSVGRAVPWLEVAIHDEQNRPLPTGEAGQIIVRETQAGALFDGYFRNASAPDNALGKAPFTQAIGANSTLMVTCISSAG